MLYRAERRGAVRLLGLDLKPARVAAGQAIIDACHSKVEIREADFAKDVPTDMFDDVLVLNVLHHVADFTSFLTRAAGLAKDRLIVEYPTLQDPQYLKAAAIGSDAAASLNAQSLIALMALGDGQGFFFTPRAIADLISGIGGFSLAEMPSPLPGRRIAIATRLR